MSKRVPPLSAESIREAKALKPTKLWDGGGLFLLVNPSGSKLWRLKYRFGGKEKLISLGKYPEVSISDARKLRSDARQFLLERIDPSMVWQEEKEREKAFEAKADDLPSVRVLMRGGIEIWKGRKVIRLTDEEALFLRDLINRLGANHAE
ncbi:MAG: DUF4102 domain-containing protein [Deltaproteobacteria bacterium]|nr:DUF4102 domain-containing protein [Deltaproteobacteria bacterium]